MPRNRSSTLLLMCAAHMYPDEIYSDLDERSKHPYKAATPELGLGFDLIHAELTKSRERAMVMKIIIFIGFVITLLQFWLSEELSPLIMVPYIAVAIFEYINQRAIKKNIRYLLEKNYPSTQAFQSDNRNISISGGYAPFIGSGFQSNSWSFCVDATKQEDCALPIKDVDTNKFYEAIEKSIISLCIPDIQIKDEIFVDGRDVNHLAHLLPSGRFNRPITFISALNKDHFANLNNNEERYYKVVRLPLWNWQIVISVFLRVVKVKNNIFFEVRFFVLPPLKKKFIDIINISALPSFREKFIDLIMSMLISLFSWLSVFISFINYIQGGFLAESNRRKAWRREVEANSFYNYGWVCSLREKWSENFYERFFQNTDKDFYEKLITSNILECILEFLEDHNISTAQFKQTTERIVNEGIIISGGALNAENLAVGRGSKIKNLFRRN